MKAIEIQRGDFVMLPYAGPLMQVLSDRLRNSLSESLMDLNERQVCRCCPNNQGYFRNTKCGAGSDDSIELHHVISIAVGAMRLLD